MECRGQTCYTGGEGCFNRDDSRLVANTAVNLKNGIYVNGKVPENPDPDAPDEGKVELNNGGIVSGTAENSALYVIKGPVYAQGVTFTGGEVAIDGKASDTFDKAWFELDEGVIDAPMNAFTTKGGDVYVYDSTVKSGVWANPNDNREKGYVLLSNTKVSGDYLASQGNSLIEVSYNSQVKVNHILASNQVWIDNKQQYADENGGASINFMGEHTDVTAKTLKAEGKSEIHITTGAKVLVKDSAELVDQSKIEMQSGAMLDAYGKVTMDDTSYISIDGSTMTMREGSELHLKAADKKTSFQTFAAAPEGVSVTNKGTLIFENGSKIYTTADATGKIQTVATATADSTITVDKNAGLYVENAVADNKTKYDFSSAILKADTAQGWDGRIFANTQRVELNKDTGLYELHSFQDAYGPYGLFAASAMQAAYDAGKGDAFAFISAVEKANQTTDSKKDAVNVAGALNGAAGLSGLGGVGYGTYSFTDTLSSLTASHKADDSGVWASYIHDKRTADGLSVGSLSTDYDLSYDGFVVGADFGNTANARYGVALAYADGDVSTNGGLVSTKNDADYYGGALYGVWDGQSGVTYKAELGYTKSSNDLTQYNTGVKITGSPDADAFYAGVRAEKSIASGADVWTPYAGLRYVRLAVDDYTDSLGFKHSMDNAGIWNLPVGVTYRHEVTSGDWTYAPEVELGYLFAFGDKDVNETVSFGAGSDTFGVDVAENSFLGRLGFTASKDNLSFGVHYGYQKGSSTKSQAWGLSASLKF